MRDLIGHLVARKGAERGAARTTVGISKEFLSRDDRADRVHVLIDTRSVGAGIFTNDPATGRVAATRSVDTGRPITIVYAGENILNPATLGIAGAIPGFGLFD
jgi:hypothetical protein